MNKRFTPKLPEISAEPTFVPKVRFRRGPDNTENRRSYSDGISIYSDVRTVLRRASSFSRWNVMEVSSIPWGDSFKRFSAAAGAEGLPRLCIKQSRSSWEELAGDGLGVELGDLSPRNALRSTPPAGVTRISRRRLDKHRNCTEIPEQARTDGMIGFEVV